jgi:hypothetical protein
LKRVFGKSETPPREPQCGERPEAIRRRRRHCEELRGTKRSSPEPRQAGLLQPCGFRKDGRVAYSSGASAAGAVLSPRSRAFPPCRSA